MSLQRIFFTSLSVVYHTILIGQVGGKSGSLMFRTKEGKEHVVTSRNCSGIFFKTATTSYECACITGVWGFYEKFCGEPQIFLGGNDYCFGLSSSIKLIQVAIFGNVRDPFESSISYFQKENFVQLTATISENEYQEYNRLELDALGSWITVSNDEWTLYGDQGETVCLRPTVAGRRVFCTYNLRLLKVLERLKWNTIHRVEKGCTSNVKVKADACYPFRGPNDKSNCTTPPIMTPCPDPDNKNDANPTDPFCDKELEAIMIDTPRMSRAISKKTVTPQCGEISRDDVKRYWIDPSSNQCAKSINDALLTDQLRRFATTRLNSRFDERLQSLDQMKQLIFHSRDIMKRTCRDNYVPVEFLDVATEAFLMFVNEDFFYGVEGIEQIILDRVLSNLKKCWKRAKAFVYETESIMGCDLKKITGSLILPTKKVEIKIPESAKSKHFEPLIETTWKILLNAHSYCFEDFEIPNDHHHFSLLFLELFTKTIYEKWIEPLTNKELYKFILPKFDVMNEIMENIEFCVAAVEQVSQCPVWMTRSNPEAKPIMESIDHPSVMEKRNKIDHNSSKNIVTTQHRKKRSSWVREIDKERTSIWEGSAYCIKNMIDPSRLGLATCMEAF